MAVPVLLGTQNNERLGIGMRAQERVKASYPEAVVVREVGTFVGGKIRDKVLLKPNGRKAAGYGQRESWAWADASRALGL
jgi:hypothetical protein